MEKYNYFKVLMSDISDYLNEHYPDCVDTLTMDEYDKLYDEMFISDQITGFASGSYFLDAYTAEEAICHNMDLFKDAYEELFGRHMPVQHLCSAEWIDLVIRCYLLSSCLAATLEVENKSLED